MAITTRNRPWRTVSGDTSPRVGLVLSGGGARGAYEVGAVAGIVDALDLKVADRPPFSIFCGTSVGAVNAAYLAGAAHRGDLDIANLGQVWRSMEIGDHFRVAPKHLWQAPRGPVPDDAAYGPQLLDTSALASLIRDAIDWPKIHDNLRTGQAHALVVAALDVADGATTLFAETAPHVDFKVSQDPSRRAVCGPVGPEEVLASSAIPFLFPGRRVAGRHFVDGGVRFNTPIAPALRCGADRLVVISLLHDASAASKTSAAPKTAAPKTAAPKTTAATGAYPSAFFLAGKMLNALLLDPIGYDLQVLDRINGLVEVLDEVLTDEERRRVDDVTRRTRGAAYRRVDTLVLQPSADIGRLSGQHLRRLRDAGAFQWIVRYMLGRLDTGEPDWEADWASFLLFDGGFAEALMKMGHDDVMARRDEVRRFFGRGRK